MVAPPAFPAVRIAFLHPIIKHSVLSKTPTSTAFSRSRPGGGRRCCLCQRWIVLCGQHDKVNARRCRSARSVKSSVRLVRTIRPRLDAKLVGSASPEIDVGVEECERRNTTSERLVSSDVLVSVLFSRRVWTVSFVDVETTSSTRRTKVSKQNNRGQLHGRQTGVGLDTVHPFTNGTADEQTALATSTNTLIIIMGAHGVDKCATATVLETEQSCDTCLALTRVNKRGGVREKRGLKRTASQPTEPGTSGVLDNHTVFQSTSSNRSLDVRFILRWGGNLTCHRRWGCTRRHACRHRGQRRHWQTWVRGEHRGRAVESSTPPGGSARLQGPPTHLEADNVELAGRQECVDQSAAAHRPRLLAVGALSGPTAGSIHSPQRWDRDWVVTTAIVSPGQCQ